jgi:hypothetical protein
MLTKFASLIFLIYAGLLTGFALAENGKFPIAVNEQTNEDEKLTLTTVEGVTYQSCIIKRSDSSSVTFSHSRGVAKIPFSEFPQEIQKKLGYDPEAVEKQRRQEWHLLPLSKRYQITPSRLDGISLKYEDHQHLAQEEKDKARNERTSTERLNASLSRIPKGGRLVITVRRSTIGAANTEYFLAIVTDPKGNEIVRRYGPDDIANTPSTPGGSWWNLFLVDIPKDIGKGVNVRIVDRLDNDVSDFTLRPTK